MANGFITILLVKKLRHIGLQIHVNQDLGTPLANALAALSFQRLGVLLYLISVWLWAGQWFRFPYLCICASGQTKVACGANLFFRYSTK